MAGRQYQGGGEGERKRMMAEVGKGAWGRNKARQVTWEEGKEAQDSEEEEVFSFSSACLLPTTQCAYVGTLGISELYLFLFLVASEFPGLYIS